MSAPLFFLDVDIVGSDRVNLRLSQRDSARGASRDIDLAAHPLSLWEGLFDTRAHLDRYAGSLRIGDQLVDEPELLERIGTFLGRDVLGPELCGLLAAGLHRRQLVVRLPQSHENPMAAAFARVPWEIARPGVGQATLAARNLAVRLSLSTAERGAALGVPTDPEPADETRVLLVFAEPPGSRPLAMRQERETLLRLFEQHIMPKRRVRVDVLCHGVTRAELEERVRRAEGYHVLHWSGHGHQNRLDLWTRDGEADPLTGDDLVHLLSRAGGFVPHLVFLNCCLSGALVGQRDWPALRAAWAGQARRRRAPPDTVWSLFGEAPPGYAGTALALLRVGVPAVIAMRYEVSDAYARDLAVLVHRRLLADDRPQTPANALAAARRELLDRGDPAHEHGDHATAVLFGADDRPMRTPEGPSAALIECRPQPQPLLAGSRDLDPPVHFVGRGSELENLRAQWLADERGPAVTLIQGLAGLGKTALAAEAVHLWHHLFDGVLAFQCKGAPLAIDDFLLRFDQRLSQHSLTYRLRCERHPNARVFLSPAAVPAAELRHEMLRNNVVDTLRSVGILVVLDNFETLLEPVDAGRYVCADPRWDALLACLASELPGSRSRLVITSRHIPAALAQPASAAWLPLGPLPVDEAALMVESHADLRRLALSSDPGEALLAERVLRVSRGHPLILDRLARLARVPDELADALEQLEARGLHDLPDIFTRRLSQVEREREHTYLEDVAVRAVDLALARVSLPARRLLWLVALASESVPNALASAIWSEDTHAGPSSGWVRELLAAGLLAVEAGEQLGIHELVRERIGEWMVRSPQERGSWEPDAVWKAYGEGYAASFEQIALSEDPEWRQQAPEQGRRALMYLLRAGDVDRADEVGRLLVITTDDSGILGGVITELRSVIDGLPDGRLRRRLQVSVAEAEDNRGRPDQSLALFEEAATAAAAAEDWAELADMEVSRGHALRNSGRLDEARRAFERSVEAGARADATAAERLGGELEMLRIDIMQGRARDAWPAIEAVLMRTKAWWHAHRAGKLVPEAPSGHFIGQLHAAALDAARFAKTALDEWSEALALTREGSQVQTDCGADGLELAKARFREHAALLHLGRIEEAQSVAEECLADFREATDAVLEARALSALAEVWRVRGDVAQAAAIERQALALHSRQPELAYRSLSHYHLGDCLTTLGEEAEADRQYLAAAVYALIAGHTQYLARMMANLALRYRRKRAAGHAFVPPRLQELLQREEFAPLKVCFDERGLVASDVQETLDELQALARSEAIGEH